MPDETDHEFEFCPAATYKKLLLIDLQAETASDEFFWGGTTNIPERSISWLQNRKETRFTEAAMSYSLMSNNN